jgi:hypothetical protein
VDAEFTFAVERGQYPSPHAIRQVLDGALELVAIVDTADGGHRLEFRRYRLKTRRKRGGGPADRAARDGGET